MKKAWEEVLTKWRFENLGAMISRADFAPLLEKALDQMLQKETSIINGFRKCGLVPFDPEAIDYESLPKQQHRASPNLTSVNQTTQIVNLSDLLIVDIPENQTYDIIDELPVQTSSIAHNHENRNASLLLDAVNQRLPAHQLAAFRQNRSKLLWPGPEEDTSLFLFWRNLKDEVEGPPEYLILDSPSYNIIPETSQDSVSNTESIGYTTERQVLPAVVHVPDTSVIRPAPSSVSGITSRIEEYPEKELMDKQ
ncbi:uncharacterized protein LOC134203260 [Armigeres subalbatus]|uniref:uncharacterized protein LOC134203260 n=1 Tax=Armigeres subalbatus TaxID=124917 RepID=UPI002ED4D9EE